MSQCSTFVVPADHPAFEGHFPGRRILPGVALLDEAARRIGAHLSPDAALTWQVSRVKFLSPALPADRLELQWSCTERSDARFRILRGTEVLAEGTMKATAL